MSTWPFEIRFSRWALGACTQVMSAASVPSSFATYLATSTSNPVYSLPFFRPSPGWSNLMPTFRPPAPALPPELAVPPEPVSPASEPQAARPSAAAATTANAPIRRVLICAFLPGGAAGAGCPAGCCVCWLVAEDLSEEVLGTVAARVGEELLGCRLLDDLPVG